MIFHCIRYIYHIFSVHSATNGHQGCVRRPPLIAAADARPPTRLSVPCCRYVSQVTVTDTAGERKWHFLCNSWLATNLGDGERDRVFMPVSKKELFSFRYSGEMMMCCLSLRLCSFSSLFFLSVPWTRQFQWTYLQA